MDYIDRICHPRNHEKQPGTLRRQISAQRHRPCLALKPVLKIDSRVCHQVNSGKIDRAVGGGLRYHAWRKSEMERTTSVSIHSNRGIACLQRDARRLKVSGSASSKTSSIPFRVNGVPWSNPAGAVSKWAQAEDLWLSGLPSKSGPMAES